MLGRLFKNCLSISILGSLLIAVPAQAEKVSPETIPDAVTVSAEQAKALFDEGVVFVDVRSDKDFAAGRIPDAVHLNSKSNWDEGKLAAEVGKGDKVVIYCNGPSCMRSSKASAQAVSWGFTGVHYFRLGFPEWKNKGYPVE